MTPSPAWYDQQYNNRGRIPEHPAILQHWSDASAAARANLACALGLAHVQRDEGLALADDSLLLDAE